MAIQGFYRSTENDDLRISEDGLTRVSADYQIIPAGIRTSEAGDTRVTEDGITRTTFGFELPDANLQATGSVTSTLNVSTFISASLSSAGSTLNAGEGTFVDQANLTATSSVAADGLVILIESADLQSTGTIASDGLRTCFADSSLSTVGSKIAAAERTCFGRFQSSAEDVIRILENGDTRHTEAGDTRISTTIYGNTGVGSVVALPTKTFFSSQPYYKKDGTWDTFVPYVKWNGAWTGNLKIYKHTNGAWKRSY
jgi:hypothetical protein